MASAPRVILTGPTASGKGDLAHRLALSLGGEVILVDSMKVYREMDIATAKPSAARRAEVRYHLLDLVDPAEEFSVGEWLPRAMEAMREVEGRGRAAVFCGGTPLYLYALLEGLFTGPEADWGLRRALEEEAALHGPEALHRRLAAADPRAAAKIHPNDRRRIIRALEVETRAGRPMTEMWRQPAARLEEGSYRMYGIGRDRGDLYRRIDLRVERLVGQGLFDEARRLASRPRCPGRAASQCIGYKEVIAGDREGTPRAEVIALIQRDTRRFAKQQLTWFRRFPIRWVAAGGGSRPEDLAAAVLADLGGAPR